MKTVNERAECLRCGENAVVDETGAVLVHFVCRVCRLDDNEWDYARRKDGIFYTIKAMEQEGPDARLTGTQTDDGRN